MTSSEFAEIFALVRGLYPFWKASGETLKAFELALGGRDAAVVRAAVLYHAQTSEFPPSVFHISNLIAEKAEGIPDAEAILDEIMRKVRDDGYTHPPGKGIVLSAVARATADTVGWQTLCDSENPEATRAHIMRIAATYRKRAIEQSNVTSAGLKPNVPCPPLARAREQKRLDQGRDLANLIGRIGLEPNDSTVSTKEDPDA